MKIKIDKIKCAGCGTCAQLYGELFKVGEDGKSEIIKTDEKNIDMEKVNQVINSCPMKAISVALKQN